MTTTSKQRQRSWSRQDTIHTLPLLQLRTAVLNYKHSTAVVHFGVMTSKLGTRVCVWVRVLSYSSTRHQNKQKVDFYFNYGGLQSSHYNTFVFCTLAATAAIALNKSSATKKISPYVR